MILKNKTYHVNCHWLFEEFFMKDDVSLVATGLLDNNQKYVGTQQIHKCCLFSIMARCKYIAWKLMKLYNIQSQMAPFWA